ncbi:MAG: Crp/Fnr family transcriptional regulator [Cryomorphaceae bacterium]|nr:Crp/Fnr family transcriptional regulator [Cryomorphaceae bacterium]
MKDLRPVDVFAKKDLRQGIREYVDASEAEIDALFAAMQGKKVKKNSHLIRQGDEPCAFILIEEGVLMTYFTDHTGDDHVLMFGFSGWWTGDIKGITRQTPSEYSVKALTDAYVYEIDFERYELLCQNHPVFERYFRKIFQNSLVTHQKRIMRQISTNAEDKYLAFKARFPKIELIVAQKHIASYLGITPEFFSALKKRMS